LRDRNRKPGFALYLIAALFICFASFAATDPAFAQCIISGTTDTCTGNVPSADYDTGSNNPITTNTLGVNSLNANVAPASGTIGLSITSEGGDGSGGRDGGVGIGVQSGDPGNDGNNLILNYNQPGANVTISTSGAVITTNATGVNGLHPVRLTPA
jgi:hypothetical protein